MENTVLEGTVKGEDMLSYFRGDTRESQRDVTKEDEGRLVLYLSSGGDEFGEDVDGIEGLTVGLTSPLCGGEKVIF